MDALSLNLKKSFTGRNNSGSLVIYSKSTIKYKRIYRAIDFQYTTFGNTFLIHRIEYDPNRSSFISLLFSISGLFCYFLTTEVTIQGDIVHTSSTSFFPKNGDIAMLKHVADGCIIHNTERFPFFGSVYSRSAGSFCILIKKYLYINRGLIKLKSGIYKLVSLNCKCIIGKVSNF